MTYRPPKTVPCAVQNCPAMVWNEGEKCSVHRLWANGPHPLPCVKCRKAIVFGDLWRTVSNDPQRPAHSQCLPRGQRKRFKKQPRLFE